jgi:hypothetical protein
LRWREPKNEIGITGELRRHLQLRGLNYSLINDKYSTSVGSLLFVAVVALTDWPLEARDYVAIAKFGLISGMQQLIWDPQAGIEIQYSGALN